MGEEGKYLNMGLLVRQLLIFNSKNIFPSGLNFKKMNAMQQLMQGGSGTEVRKVRRDDALCEPESEYTELGK